MTFQWTVLLEVFGRNFAMSNGGRLRSESPQVGMAKENQLNLSKDDNLQVLTSTHTSKRRAMTPDQERRNGSFQLRNASIGDVRL